MNENFFLQAYTLSNMFYAGLLLGLSYDVLKHLTAFLNFKEQIYDIFFWVASLIFISNILFDFALLEFNFYYILLFILGWAFYLLSMSFLVNKLLTFVFSLLERFKTKISLFLSAKKQKFYLKHKKSLTKVKVLLKRASRLPFNEKMRYNKFIKYLTEKEGIQNCQKGEEDEKAKFIPKKLWKFRKKKCLK